MKASKAMKRLVVSPIRGACEPHVGRLIGSGMSLSPTKPAEESPDHCPQDEPQDHGQRRKPQQRIDNDGGCGSQERVHQRTRSDGPDTVALPDALENDDT